MSGLLVSVVLDLKVIFHCFGKNNSNEIFSHLSVSKEKDVSLFLFYITRVNVFALVENFIYFATFWISKARLSLFIIIEVSLLFLFCYRS